MKLEQKTKMREIIYIFLAFFNICSVISDNELPCNVIPETKFNPGDQILGYQIKSNITECCDSCFKNDLCTYFHFVYGAIPLCIQYHTNITLNELNKHSSAMLNYALGYVLNRI